ncbi:hypothetical protein [Roseateles saccharophilus]|uniref:Uncharacterized protein n=1 Tax=Roseateles saccharophilus TaxID=304 RepID=A0A4R3UHD6_ROSSA|nr:hypothetical protein [Roseateles saccharophilus]MDG0834949.1 hypothetical protein [Roseateles saccharophilus]TCU88364.1 hypothetical protein EV671_104035 [Roseateles saccharophilus]
MQPQLRAFAQDSLHQIRDTMRRVKGLHEAASRSTASVRVSGSVEQPKPDAVAWEDTEIDVRRVVL